jgi:hypothetical protein
MTEMFKLSDKDFKAVTIKLFKEQFQIYLKHARTKILSKEMEDRYSTVISP